ncbi:MAG: LysM peptidoglycan-binding domain-containing protein [Muribaculaceae bacterium]|nr:LysM peptidoglycan-binding domain-containing protein [Muribaculaceae bacterium]
MEIKRRIIAAAALAALTTPAFAGPDLPKVEILGKEYYYYEVKKGDSVYGIAKQFDWDPQELVRLNPGTTSSLEKGARLYYPTGRVVVIATTPDAEAPVEIPFEPITHIVKRGETPYSIARRYNISLDTLYANHPSAKYGIKAGETIVIKQQADMVDRNGGFYYYTVKPGDTLFALSRKYNTTVEKILAANPGVSEKHFRIGDSVRIPVNTDTARRVKTVLAEEKRVESLDTYRVGKNDTWATIAEKTGTDEEDLRRANGDLSAPGNNQLVAVPTMRTVQVEKEVDADDFPTQGEESVQEIYDSVHAVEKVPMEERQVRVALVLDDPASKRDSEFVKGFMLALNDYKDTPYKISLKLERGSDESAALASLKEYNPNLVISTADRNFPAWLGDYGQQTKTEIVNVYDVKNELYLENPQMVQVLTPTNFFNESTAAEIAKRFEGRTLVFVGEPDAQDTLAPLVKEQMMGASLELSAEEFSALPLEESGSYLVYAWPTAQGDIERVLDAVATARSNSPVAEVAVVGRPNWIVYTESLGSKMHDADVYIPSRFYFDFDSNEGRGFVSDFTAVYGYAPVKSYPLYAAVGFDMANYFVPGVAVTGGDFNHGVPDADSLQTAMRMERVSNWSGFYNPVTYLVRLTPYGSTDKIIVK